MVAHGEVWWVDFGEPFGSEPAFQRPALIVSSDRFNRSRIRTVLVCILTSNMRLADAPGNVELTAGAAGLPKASVVNVSQTTVIDRERLIERIGLLDAAVLHQIDDGLRLVLAL